MSSMLIFMARVILNTYFSGPAHGATEENIAIVGQVWVTIFYPPTLKGLSLIKHQYISQFSKNLLTSLNVPCKSITKEVLVDVLWMLNKDCTR